MNAEAIRRTYLERGGNATATASELGISRSAVYQALERANKRSPLVVPRVTLPELDPRNPDSQAIAAYVRASLAAAGIQRA